MKVFLFQKNLEDDEKHNTKLIRISKHKNFNYISFNNPKDGKTLYIIHTLILKGNKDAKKAKLIIRNTETNNESENHGELNIECDSLKEEQCKNLEIDEINLDNMETNLLKNKYLILIPGGTFSVKLDNFVKDIEFSLDVKEKDI